MGLEAATYIGGLVITNPAGTDNLSQADDHMRLIKTVLKNSFPNITSAVNATPAQLNLLVGATAIYNRKSNFAASGAPTTGDDVNSGYAVGSWWFNTSAQTAYVCLNATAGAAVWKQVTLT